jgi:4-amino-4-deoxy-L-arabinose transferase-like glycosyltransferase
VPRETEVGATDSPSARTSGADAVALRTAVSILLLAMAVPVFFLFLGANSIWDANEAFYVETPRQMLLSGDVVNPTFNGLPRFNKPVLSYWIVAGLYRAFGESVTVERVGIATGAMGILFATFLVGRALSGTSTGALAALCLATSPWVVWSARRIFIDVYLTLFMALALACFVQAEREPGHRRLYLLLGYIAIGLGVLTKGPVALVLPALVCLAWLGVERRLQDLARLQIGAGALLVLVIVVPWYAIVYLQHGWTYITRFLIDENLGRYTTSMAPGTRNVLFYLPVLFGGFFPWGPLLIVPLIATARAWWRRPAEDTDRPDPAIRRLLWLWIVIIVAVFSFSRTKEDLYILPVAPAVAALVADALVGGGARHSRALGAMFLVVAGLCVALAAGLYSLFGPGAGFYALSGAVSFAAVLAASGLAALTLWLRRQRAIAVFALAAGFIVLNYLFVARVLPGLERFKPVPSFARLLAARAAPDGSLGAYHMGLPSLVYYARRPVREIGSMDEATTFLQAGHEAWLVTGADEWRAIHERRSDLCVADRGVLFDAKFDRVVTHTPPPDVLLVTNQCGRR